MPICEIIKREDNRKTWADTGELVAYSHILNGDGYRRQHDLTSGHPFLENPSKLADLCAPRSLKLLEGYELAFQIVEINKKTSPPYIIFQYLEAKR